MSIRNEFTAQGTKPVISHRGLFTAAAATAAAVAVATVAAPLAAFASDTSGSAPTSDVSVVVNARLSADQLDALLDARLAPGGAAATQQGAFAALQVQALLGSGAGTVSPDGKLLTVPVPAIGGIGTSVDSALAPIGYYMSALSGSNGQVAGSVNDTVTSVSPLLDLTGPNASVTANVPINLASAVAPALSGSTGSGVVTINPSQGTIVIDLSKLLPTKKLGTTDVVPALSGQDQAQVAADVNAAAAMLGQKIVASATSSVEATPLTVAANVHLLTEPATSASTTCTAPSTGSAASGDPVSDAFGSGTPVGSVPVVGSLLGAVGSLLGGVVNGVTNSAAGGVLSGTVGDVTGTVDGVLCSVTGLLPSVLTSLSLTLGGTVGQVIEGTAPPASGSVTVLGQPSSIDPSAVNYGVAGALVNNFAGPQASTAPSTTTTTGSGTGTNSGSAACPAARILLSLCVDVNLNPGGTVGGVLGGVGGTVGGVLGGLGGTLGGVLGGLGSTLNGTLNGLGSTLNGTLNGVGSTVNGTLDGVGSTVNSTLDGVGSTVNGLGSTLNGVGSAVTGALPGTGSGTGSSGSSGSSLLNVNVGASGSGATATVGVGKQPSGTPSTPGNLLNVNVGTGASGSGLINVSSGTGLSLNIP